ncbi:aldose 1-epimerase family protein [Chitinophaga tropicalis]|uniref:Aldose 1-epimerase family protein n=1 Tax=Chitinophaga tropicalis TaxID=2683588 RepID=A0A7K1U3T5_9BACT|nr:aldose 1-epimerase family protein [Chitinophaga tropicalis]MVT09023.1 aldose 1-epimerase family protein [Chitinophaga tropicalis]
MPEISNDHVHVVVAEKGAELQSIVRKDLKLEYLWSAGPEWAKKSPVLFPVVGTLKNNTYTYKGESYTLGRHGFARDRVFTLTAQTEHKLTFTLTHDEESLKVYPFHFTFHVVYTLHGTTLDVTYIVENTGKDALLFSVGAHPAFKVPLTDGLSYEDYYLHFNVEENAGLWPLSNDGLIEASPEPYLVKTHKLPLKKQLFYKDALVFKGLESNIIDLKSDKSPHGLSLRYDGFPYMGIWAAKDADFVCIEPWCGIADSVNATGVLSHKEGIQHLAAGKHFERSWSVRLF